MSSTNNITLDANTLGARVTISLVVLGLMVEVLSDNLPNWNQAPAMTIEACVDLCTSQGQEVERVEAWACACRPWPDCREKP